MNSYTWNPTCGKLETGNPETSPPAILKIINKDQIPPIGWRTINFDEAQVLKEKRPKVFRHFPSIILPCEKVVVKVRSVVKSGYQSSRL